MFTISGNKVVMAALAVYFYYSKLVLIYNDQNSEESMLRDFLVVALRIEIIKYWGSWCWKEYIEMSKIYIFCIIFTKMYTNNKKWTKIKNKLKVYDENLPWTRKYLSL